MPLRGWSRLLATLAICVGFTACGGGDGDGSGETTLPPPTGLRVTVSDTYGARVADATVEATVGTANATATTDAEGVALLVFRGTEGSASVTTSRSTFISKTVAATLTPNQLTELALTLDRATSAAGGSLTARVSEGAITPIVDSASGMMTFEIELVVVGSNSQPIENLSSTDFVLRSCTPDPASSRVDCVRGTDASFDAAYVPATGTPEAVATIPGLQASPYAAGLMLDQSGSIYTSDATGARLYSAKAFLDGLGNDDRVLLAAFADGPDAKIPDLPLTVYPEFRDANTVSSAPSYYSTLDSLATLVGGNTPLYDALDLMRERIVNDLSLPAGIAKSVVIFTDGDDTDPDCSTSSQCRQRRDQSIAAAKTAGVRVFTIGLSSGVNFEALGELANKTGGAFLFAENAEQLIPLYGSVGRLLSLSLPTYRLRWTIQAASPDALMSGNAILGQVQVTAGGSTFDVPFIVGIP